MPRNWQHGSEAVLREIMNLVDTTASQVRSIAVASEQQSASSEEINRSVLGVNTIAGETATGMTQAAATVSSMTAQVGELPRTH